MTNNNSQLKKRSILLQKPNIMNVFYLNKKLFIYFNNNNKYYRNRTNFTQSFTEFKKQLISSLITINKWIIYKQQYKS